MPQLVINEQAISLSNLEKVFWPEDGYTKHDLLTFYIEISAFYCHISGIAPVISSVFLTGSTAKVFIKKICRNLHRIGFKPFLSLPQNG